MHLELPGLLACTAAVVFLAWTYYGRVEVRRPPIGVINLWDIAALLIGIVCAPLLYLTLPRWLAGALIALAVISIAYFTLEPLVRSRAGIWAAVLVFAGADLLAFRLAGPGAAAFVVVNDAVIMLVVVGVANLWAQSGLTPRDAAILGGALAIYDFVATSRMALMNDLIAKMGQMPFAPQLAWGAGEGRWLMIGLGDLLLAAMFPLAMRKGFGARAGLLAAFMGVASTAAMLALLDLGVIRVTIPAMVVLGPLAVLQYAYFARRVCRTPPF